MFKTPIMKTLKFLCVVLLLLASLPSGNSFCEEDFEVKLEHKLRVGRTYVYSVTSSHSVQGDIPQPMFWQTDKQMTKVVERNEEGNFLLETRMDKELKQRNVAVEYFRRNFPSYQVELTPEGYMTTPPRQPFPQVRNVPVFPSYPLGKGDKWVLEDVPFFPGGLIDEVNADWEYEVIEFVKHNDFNSAHISATAFLNIDPRTVTIAFLGFFGDPDRAEDGAFIREIVPDSPADAAGLLPGDMVLTIAEVRISDWWDIPELLPFLPPESEVTVKYSRDNEESEVVLTTGATELGTVQGTGTFTFDIYFGVSRGHIISLEGKTDDLTLYLEAEGKEEVKYITSQVFMEFLPEGK